MKGRLQSIISKDCPACIDENFTFQGRNRRPPRDEFNSMISLGYSILMNEVYCKVEMKGLNPYFGFIHRDAEKQSYSCQRYDRRMAGNYRGCYGDEYD